MQVILVVVENLSPSSWNLIMSIIFDRYKGGEFSLDSWCLIDVLGKDAETFLHGQLTNDIEKLECGHAQLNARLDRNGRLKNYCYVAKSNNRYFIFAYKSHIDQLINDLERYIIMEDVRLALSDHKVNVLLGHEALHNSDSLNVYKSTFYGEECLFRFVEDEDKNMLPISQEILDELIFFSGWPNLNQEFTGTELINNTLLVEYAISFSKGCFLGQETVAKIHVNKGASNYPALLEFEEFLETHKSQKIFVENELLGVVEEEVKEMNSKFYTLIKVQRSFRVNHKEHTISLAQKKCKGKVLLFPFYDDSSFLGKSKKLFHKALENFQNGNEAKALEILDSSIFFNPLNGDAIESKGVILGRQEKFDQAIECMNQLLEVDPDSIMAHTNKSLFLMKMGKIEEAEEEKAKATVKSFEVNAKNSDINVEDKIENELKEREEMFLQVLEIDIDDALANFGMAEINMKRKDFSSAEDYLKRTLTTDPKYSQAYLVLGTLYSKIGKEDQAKEVLLEGIKIASKKGEIGPANQMQAQLNSL
jgi:folate-binding protein YgfZ